MKEHDLFLDMIANPTFSLGMFQMAGLTADNTGMQDEEFYKNNELVQKKFTDSNGNFDDKKFKTAFQSAKVAYNKFATDTFLDSARELVTYSENNITVPFEKRRDSSEEIQLFKSINPLKQQTGLITLGRTEAPKQTIEEIAQNNKVYDSETDSWQSSPNDSFFDNFFETRVLAQYEEDGYHNDPVTGEKIKHTKGDFKLNEDGQYYYENLNGRSVAGKIVLNKLNTITRDGSKFNKYDFFDSDDKEKSLGGTLLKNIALVAPMFIPYIGPVYTGASIAVNSANFLSVLGKMFLGSDNTVLNDIEGFTESFNRQGLKSDYAKNNTWCWENFINLAGDVVAQLKEQRFLFQYTPALFKGKIGLTKENQKEAVDKWANDYFKSKMSTIDDDMAKKSAEILNTKGKKVTFNRAKVESEYLANSRGFAENKMQDFMKSYNSIGGTISKAYMTGITVNDMYGEAKQAGASDFEATLLTLGYAAAEYALLSTDIGSHIIPEINNPKFRNKAIAQALKEKATENTMISSMSKQEKQNWVKKLFNKGKEIAQLDYTKGGRVLPSLFSHGFAESVEETSEEFLADFAKSCYNLTQWLQGDESRLKSFDNILDRYAMSAIGGFVGGGINGISINPDVNTGKLSYNQAIQELTYKIRNKEIDSFLKFLDKTTIADKNLSFTKFTKDDSGNIIYDAAQNKEDSWDFNVKKAIKNQINLIDNILSAEGANISDDSFLTQQTLGDIRFNTLVNSNVAGKYLQEFNSTTINLMESLLKLDGISKIDFKTGKLLTDQQKRNKEENDLNTEIENQKIKELKEEVEKYRKLKDDFITGKKAPEFIRDALFEMSPVLNYYFTKPTFQQYAEYISKKSFETIPEKEREELKKKYTIWLETEAKDDIHSKAEMFEEILHKFSKVISEHKSHIETNNDEITQHLSNYYEGLQNTEDISFLSNALSGLLDSNKYTNILAQLLDSKQFDQNLSKFNNERKTLEENKELNDADKEEKLKSITKDFLESSQDIIINNIDSLVKKYIDQGYINAETKIGLRKVIHLLYERYQPNIYDEGFIIDSFNGNDQADNYTKLLNYNTAIGQLRESSIIEEFINKASINITGNPINIQTLLDNITTNLNSNANNLEQFILEEDTYTQLKEALSVIHIYKSAIEASKNDNVSFQTQFNNEGFVDTSELWGFNKTLNEINEKNKTENWEKLPELDSNTANLILQDINIIYNKLNSVKNLYELAQGQKITKQNRVTSNTNYLLYNKIKSFSSYIPDDWKNKDKLLEALNAETIKKYSQSRNLSISDSEQEELLKERFLIEDAIYDFFQSNQDKIKDVKELKRIINSKNYNLLENPTEILTESLENLDDNSFIYYLASRAAVKASDFYYKYKQILPKNIAPFATQELATYLNYAYAVNGSVINQFFKAFQESSVEAFENLNTQEREKLGINRSLTDDKYKSFSKVFGLSPVFNNLIFTEGIPGSGKTGAVFNLTIQMLKKFNPEILENVIFAHGANKESMEEYVKGMEMNTDNVMSKQELMKFISSSYIDIKSIKDEKKRQEKLKELFTIVDNQIKSTFKINKLSKKPTLLIIDEITNFNYLELDAINEFCKEYGIAALIAGDFDQTGESERLPIDDIKEFEGAKGISFNLAATRNLFVRTPKLGVSLRTANSQKTNNILQMLSIFQNNSKGEINLHYYEKDNTLLGDKFSMYLNQLEQDLDKYIIPNLKEDEKIGYIYYSEESDLYKLLTSDKYKDKVSLYKNNEAQGKEGNYYIVELSPKVSGKPALQQLYTGISRSKVASLVFQEDNTLKGVGGISITPDNMTVQENFPIEQIEKFSNSYIKLLEQLFKEEPKVTYQGIKSKSNKKSSTTNTSEADTDTSNDSDSSDDTDTDTDDDSDSDNDSDEDEDDDATDTDEDTNEDEDNDSDEDTGSDEEPEGEVKEIVSSSGNVSFKDGTKEKETSDETGAINEYALKGSEKQKKKYQAPTSSKSTINTNTINTDSTTSTKSTTTSNVEPFPIDLYSYNTYTLGIPKNSQGKLCYIENGELKVITNNTPIDSVINSERFDNLHGLAKFIPKLKNESTLEYINKLDNALSLVRKKLLHTKEKADILKFFNNQYDADNLDITFAIKNVFDYQKFYKDAKWGNLFSRPNEYLEYNTSSLSNTLDSNKPTKHDKLIARNLVAIVYEKNPENGTIKKVEVPLLSITSPISIIKQTDSKGNAVYPDLYNIYKNSKDDVEALNGIKEIKTCPQGLKDLIELYLNTKNNIFYFDSEVLGKDFASWTPAKAAESYGMELALTKGKKSQNAVDYLQNISIKLSDLRKNKTMSISKIMVYSQEGGYNYRNNTITAGHPFILVSDHPSYQSDNELLEQFKDQADDKTLPEYVKLIYVLPPKATFEEYIQNLRQVMNGDKRNVKPLGQINTSYIILRELQDNGTLKALHNSSKEGIVKQIEETLAEINPTDSNTIIRDLKGKVEQEKDDTKSIIVYQELNRLLLNLVSDKYSLGNENLALSNTINKDAASQLKESLEGINIYYSTRLPKQLKRSGNEFVEIITDENNSYQIDSRDYTIACKMDSSVFNINMGEIIYNILNSKIQQEGQFEGNSRDLKRYVKGDYSLTSQKFSKIRNQLAGKTKIDLDEIANKSENEEQFKKEVINAHNSSGEYTNCLVLQGKDIKSIDTGKQGKHEYSIINSNYTDNNGKKLGDIIQIITTNDKNEKSSITGYIEDNVFTQYNIKEDTTNTEKDQGNQDGSLTEDQIWGIFTNTNNVTLKNSQVFQPDEGEISDYEKLKEHMYSMLSAYIKRVKRKNEKPTITNFIESKAIKNQELKNNKTFNDIVTHFFNRYFEENQDKSDNNCKINSKQNI